MACSEYSVTRISFVTDRGLSDKFYFTVAYSKILVKYLIKSTDNAYLSFLVQVQAYAG